MKSIAAVVVALLGLASFPAVIFAFFHLFPLMTDALVYWRADRYVPATFEMEWARLDEGRAEAVGTVGGRREQISLGELLPRPAKDMNDLQDLVAGQERYDVFYDKEGSQTSFEGRRLRLVPAPKTGDFKTDRWDRLERTALVGYTPALLLTGLGLLVAWLRGGGVGCWMVPSVFFLACQPVVVVFILVVEALT
jgi:hypothetical protein